MTSLWLFIFDFSLRYGSEDPDPYKNVPDPQHQSCLLFTGTKPIFKGKKQTKFFFLFFKKTYTKDLFLGFECKAFKKEIIIIIVYLVILPGHGIHNAIQNI